MSQDSQSKLPFIEIITILIFVAGVVFIFLSQKDTRGYEREVLNAQRFQDVSKVADALWQLKLRDPAFVEFQKSFQTLAICDNTAPTLNNFEAFLVPQFFLELPRDPSGEMYHTAFHEDETLTVCSLDGQDENGQALTISITR